jgi:spore maturation protein CgeB
MVTAKPVLAEHFRPGVEVETFATLDELVDKTRYYLRNPERAQRIGAAGQVRAHAEHRYEHRLEVILAENLPA